jgi:hypothetical protein
MDFLPPVAIDWLAFQLSWSCDVLLGRVRKEYKMTTNRDVKESPLRYTRSRRDGIRETVSQLHVNNIQKRLCRNRKTHVEGGRVVVQLKEYSDHLMADT